MEIQETAKPERWFGYVRKLLNFFAVILANVIDTVLNLNGVLTFGTVLFISLMKDWR